MKKTVSILLVLALTLSLCGCFSVKIVLPVPEENSQNSFEQVTDFPVNSQPASAPDYSLLPSSEAPSVLTPSSELPSVSEQSSVPTEAPSSAPAVKSLSEMSNDEVITFFNTTLNEVKSQRLGFKKDKLTSILDLQLSNPTANTLVGFVKNTLLTETVDETSVSKGQSSDDVMSPSGSSFVSQLTMADVSSVKVTKKNADWVITVGVKDMNNPDKSSAYGRVFDFMTVDDVVNIYAPKVGATVDRKDIVVDFKGCYAELTIDAQNKIVSYTTYVKGIMNMNNAKVKKLVTIDTDMAITLASTTNYTNFVY